MATLRLGLELDRLQARLHDRGAVWPRAELLRLWNDGYRELLALSGAVRRWRILDVPPRYVGTVLHGWEDRHVNGTVRRISRSGIGLDASVTWELESVAGVTPSAAVVGPTSEWERAHVGQTDRHFRFALPRGHDRLVQMYWDDKRLVPVSVRELDETDTDWERLAGEPRWWSGGLGRVNTFELFELRTEYGHGWAILDGPLGIPRGINVASRGTTGTFAADTFAADTFAVVTTTSQDGGTRTFGVAVSESVANRYAYTNPGEAEALTSLGIAFSPGVGVTADWQREFGPSGFTVIGSVVVPPSGGAGGPIQKGTILSVSLPRGRPAPSSVFAIELPGMTKTTVHPWETGHSTGPLVNNVPLGGPVVANDPASPGQRGIYGWERRDPAGAYESLAPTGDPPPVLRGPGARITTPAVTAPTLFCVQPWEVDQIDGAATLRIGAAVPSFPWEVYFGAAALTLAFGTIRHVSSAERQYLAIATDPAGSHGFLGRPTDWRSSGDSVLAVEVVVPETVLGEADTPSLIPAPLAKYVGYYVLGRAFGRAGEGHNAVVSDHYTRRFARGVMLFRRLGDAAARDRVFQREATTTAVGRRPPRVQLPAEFPAVF